MTGAAHLNGLLLSRGEASARGCGSQPGVELTRITTPRTRAIAREQALFILESFVGLDSKEHVPRSSEPAWPAFLDALEIFSIDA